MNNLPEQRLRFYAKNRKADSKEPAICGIISYDK